MSARIRSGLVVLVIGLLAFLVSCGANGEANEPVEVGDVMIGEIIDPTQTSAPTVVPTADSLEELLEGLNPLNGSRIEISEVPGLQEAFDTPNVKFVKNYNTASHSEKKYLYYVDVVDELSYVYESYFEEGYILRVVVFSGNLYVCSSPTPVDVEDLDCVKITRPQTGHWQTEHTSIILREYQLVIARFNNVD